MNAAAETRPLKTDGESALMTLEEFLALPDDDNVERDLIRGRLCEWPKPMTRRNFSHSLTTTKTAHLLQQWLDQQPAPRGGVVAGEAGFRLRSEPSTTVGVDVAYISAEQRAATPKNAALVEGPPVLAVEILSPSDAVEKIFDKVGEYLQAGVALVWIADPVFGTITVYRPDAEPRLFNRSEKITAEPHLPGFRAAVAEFFL